MAIKESDLTLATTSTFNNQTMFRVLLNGKSGLLPRSIFESWMKQNVQGERGETGANGINGKDGTNGKDGATGAQGLSAYQVAVANGYVGTQAQWLTSLKGATGDTGTTGSNGWTPVISLVERDTDIVQQVVDWTGGTGTKPTNTGYIGTSGVVTNISNAVNVRGLQGEQGIQGVTGEKGEKGENGENGENGTVIDSITYDSTNKITIKTTDEKTVVSNSPNKLTGWASYKDTTYTEASPFTVQANTQIVLPNNGVTIVDSFPTGVSSLYNPTTQKIQTTDLYGAYQIRVRLKISPLAVDINSAINITFTKDTTEIPFSQDINLRDDGILQNVDLNTVIYGDESTVANGISIRIKTHSVPVSVYGIEFIIVKVV